MAELALILLRRQSPADPQALPTGRRRGSWRRVAAPSRAGSQDRAGTLPLPPSKSIWRNPCSPHHAPCIWRLRRGRCHLRPPADPSRLRREDREMFRNSVRFALVPRVRRDDAPPRRPGARMPCAGARRRGRHPPQRQVGCAPQPPTCRGGLPTGAARHTCSERAGPVSGWPTGFIGS